MSKNAQQQLFTNWENQKMTPDQISQKLLLEGYQEEQINTLLQQYKKKQIEKRIQMGFLLMAIGAFIGFISGVLIVFNLFPSWSGFIMYGVTSIGIGVAMLGGYYVFE